MYAAVKNILVQSHRRVSASSFLVNIRALSQITNHEKLNISYISHPGQAPLLGLTLGQLLQQGAEKFGDAEAVVVMHQNTRKSFKQLLEDADQMAAGFLSLGLNRGDRIGIWGPNSYEWLLTQWAAARAGLILVNINPAYRARELIYALNLVEAKAIVMANEFRNQNLLAELNELLPSPDGGHGPRGDDNELFSSSLVPSLERVIVLSDHRPPLRGSLAWKEVADRATETLIRRVRDSQTKIQFDEPANIQFTSGTTGKPKGATLSHHGIINNSYLTGLRNRYHKIDHKLCIPSPLYHAFACTAVLTNVLFGRSLILPSPVYSARETIKAIHQERCTAIYGTPTMFIDILHYPELSKYDVSSLKFAVAGGAPCTQEMASRIVNDLKIDEIAIAFGMTETSPCTFLSLETDSLERRCSSVGYPTDYTEAKVVDPITHEVVPVNTPGELWTRGYSTMLGYWNDPESTRNTITPDRWLRTGDMAVLDEDGYAQIVGRIKEMIIRGGENIFPREIEEVLHTHHQVQDVQIVGVPDSRLGEEVCAWIRPKPGTEITAEGLKQFCKDRLAYFKVPRYWLFKETFPLTVTGKVQKFAMREATIAELGLAN